MFLSPACQHSLYVHGLNRSLLRHNVPKTESRRKAAGAGLLPRPPQHVVAAR